MTPLALIVLMAVAIPTNAFPTNKESLNHGDSVTGVVKVRDVGAIVRQNFIQRNKIIVSNNEVDLSLSTHDLEHGNEHLGHGGDQPVDGGEQPVDGGDQPVDGGHQPSDSDSFLGIVSARDIGVIVHQNFIQTNYIESSNNSVTISNTKDNLEEIQAQNAPEPVPMDKDHHSGDSVKGFVSVRDVGAIVQQNFVQTNTLVSSGNSFSAVINKQLTDLESHAENMLVKALAQKPVHDE